MGFVYTYALVCLCNGRVSGCWQTELDSSSYLLCEKGQEQSVQAVPDGAVRLPKEKINLATLLKKERKKERRKKERKKERKRKRKEKK